MDRRAQRAPARAPASAPRACRGGRDTLLIAPTGKTLCRPPAEPGRSHRVRRQISRRHSHPLCIAAESSRRRHRPQFGRPGDGACVSSSRTRTGDTPPSRRQRQRLSPPNILLTKPEQVALMLSHRDAARFARSSIDELHAMASTNGRSLGARSPAPAHAVARPESDRPLGDGGTSVRACRVSGWPRRQGPREAY